MAGHIWSGGVSGSLDVRSYWDGDSIVALAEHNDYLIVFGKRNILIYANAKNPLSMYLEDRIQGIGCIARDSVQHIGSDVIFLSDSGIQALSRVVQEKSMPMRDISRNVHDDIITLIAGESSTVKIKSVYSQVEGFYLINFPTSNITICFDIRNVLPDGSNRVTKWTGINTSGKSFPMVAASNHVLYFGHNGKISYYTGYQDNGSSYTMVYYTTWIDFGNAAIEKIIKKMVATMIGGGGATCTFRWFYDYAETYDQQQITLSSGSYTSYYGTGTYGTSTYSTGQVIDIPAVQMTGTGKVVKVGLVMNVNGTGISLQKLDLFAKQGRMI